MTLFEDYINTHPLYFTLVLGSLLLVIYVIKRIISDTGNDSSDSDEGGGPGNGRSPDDPILDLPPGVSLPVEQEEDSMILA